MLEHTGLLIGLSPARSWLDGLSKVPTSSADEVKKAKKFEDLLTAGGAPEPGRPATVRERRPQSEGSREERREPDPGAAPSPLELRPSPSPDRSPAAAAAAPDLELIAQRVLAATSVVSLDGTVSVRLDIATVRLPALSVELRMDRGTLSARFGVRDQATAQVLTGMMPALESALVRRGLRVGAIDVTCAGSGDPRGRRPQRDERRRRR